MDRYALIVDGVVVNVIESETQPSAEFGNWVVCGDAGPGWLYSGEAFTPPVVDAAPVDRRITVLAARQRLGDDLVTIDLFSIDDLAADMQTRTAKAKVRKFLGDLQASTYIDLDDVRLAVALDSFVDGGLIAPARPAQIRAPDPEPHELWLTQ